MLSALIERLYEHICRSKYPTLDPKMAIQTYEALLQLNLNCPRLHEWALQPPPTPMSCYFAAHTAHVPDIFFSNSFAALITCFLPSEVIRVLDATLIFQEKLIQISSSSYLNKTLPLKTNMPLIFDEHALLDIISQCSKRVFEIRSSLSSLEIDTILDRFSLLRDFEAIRHRELLRGLLHRFWYVLEGATVPQVSNILSFFVSYSRCLPSGTFPDLFEAVSEKCIDSIGEFIKSLEKKNISSSDQNTDQGVSSASHEQNFSSLDDSSEEFTGDHPALKPKELLSELIRVAYIQIKKGWVHKGFLLAIVELITKHNPLREINHRVAQTEEKVIGPNEASVTQQWFSLLNEESLADFRFVISEGRRVIKIPMEHFSPP